MDMIETWKPFIMKEMVEKGEDVAGRRLFKAKGMELLKRNIGSRENRFAAIEWRRKSNGMPGLGRPARGGGKGAEGAERGFRCSRR